MSSIGPGGGDIFDVKKVRRLVELMKEHDLAEIDLRQGDQRVRLRRGGEPVVMTAAPASVPRPASTPVSVRRRCGCDRGGGGRFGGDQKPDGWHVLYGIES